MRALEDDLPRIGTSIRSTNLFGGDRCARRVGEKLIAIEVGGEQKTLLKVLRHVEPRAASMLGPLVVIELVVGVSRSKDLPELVKVVNDRLWDDADGIVVV